MAWNYQREESNGFEPLPEGKYRIRVKAVEKAQSKKGNEMLVFQFDVSGSNKTLYHYITFLPDNPSVTNGQLTQFFDSFKDIKDGDFTTQNWIGKVGACTVKHEEYNGNTSAKIGYFIHADKQADLPPWKDNGTSASANMVTEPVTEDLPF